MNDKNTGRRLYEQLSAVAARKRYAAGIIAGLLLAGAAHSTDIVIPAGAHNGQVVYSYNPGPTSPMTVTKSRENTWFGFCAVGVRNGPWPDEPDVPQEIYGIAHYGLAVRQVSGEIIGKSDAHGAIPNAGEFKADGTTAAHPASELMTNKNAVDVHLTGGRVEVYVYDQRLLPTEDVKMAPLAYRVGIIQFTWSEEQVVCDNLGTYAFMPDTQSMQSGPFRYPTPDGNVTLVVNNPTARTKVHNACQTGGHAGTCQRIHNFAVAHHKR